MHSIVFHTHANHKTGYGHLSRCINLSKILLKKNKKLEIYFDGSFNLDIKKWILSQVKVKISKNYKKHISIYDRMDNIENPETVNTKLIKPIIQTSKHLIFFANGKKITNKKILKNCTIIGYKLGCKKHNPPKTYWGLEYAPVNTKTVNTKKNKTILVALGGAKGNEFSNKVLSAISKVEKIKKVLFLVSPVNNITPSDHVLRPDQKIYMYNKVPDIISLFKLSSIIIASYGHLAYEAMAANIPLCLINQKKFQANYAIALAKKNLCTSVGHIQKASVNKIVKTINNTIAQSNTLKLNCNATFDGNGLKRISDIIYNICKTN